MLIDYHVHSLGHGERVQSADNIESFIRKAIGNGIKEIGFCDHDWVELCPDFSLFKELQEKFPEIRLRVGIEVDHMIGRAEEINSFIKDKPYDYILGGVHHLGENKWMFDLPDYQNEYRSKDIDELYIQYFKTVEDAALSGLYQVLPHLDLIKVLGYRPQKPVLSLMDNLLQIIKDKSLAIEINTNGLYKPVAEIYPSYDILSACFKLGIPVTIGSDAHQWENVGRNFDMALALAYKAGYRQIATFDKKKMVIRDLG